MKSLRVVKGLATAVALTGILALAACAPTPVVAPIIVNVGDISSTTVTVPINSTLVIKTGDLAVDSYTATIKDPSIAEFVQGRTDGSATFNPGFTPKKVGDTTVTLSNKNGGIQDVVFELKVTPVPGGANIGGSGR